MKQFFIHNSIIFILLFNLTFNCSAQTNPKNDFAITPNNKRIFDKNPAFSSLIDDIIKPVGYVNDYDSLYSVDEIYQIDSLLYAFEIKDSIQIVVVTFDTSQIGSSEVDWLTKVILKGWHVGGNYSRGIVIGISKPYRKMRIQYGHGIQKYLTDAATQKIVDNDFLPEFKNGNYFKGTWSGLQQLIQVLKSDR